MLTGREPTCWFFPFLNDLFQLVPSHFCEWIISNGVVNAYAYIHKHIETLFPCQYKVLIFSILQISVIRTVQLVVSKRIFARLRARIRYNFKRCKMNAILMSLLIFSVIKDGFFIFINTNGILIKNKNPHNYDTCFRFFVRFILHCF